MRKLLIAPVLLSVLFAGCPAEKDARDSIAAAHGYIQSAQAQWGDSCRANNTQLKCTTTNKLIAAQRAAADALAVYCGGPSVTGVDYANGGTCVPIKSAGGALQTAIVNMNSIITDIKKLLAGGN